MRRDWIVGMAKSLRFSPRDFLRVAKRAAWEGGAGTEVDREVLRTLERNLVAWSSLCQRIALSVDAMACLYAHLNHGVKADRTRCR